MSAGRAFRRCAEGGNKASCTTGARGRRRDPHEWDGPASMLADPRTRTMVRLLGTNSIRTPREAGAVER